MEQIGRCFAYCNGLFLCGKSKEFLRELVEELGRVWKGNVWKQM